jgi:hypothetical protein
VKKTILIAIGLVLLLAACDRKAFVKKITGTWTNQKYIFGGQDKTRMYDTTYRNWQLTLTDDGTPGSYSKTWQEYFFTQDSLIVYDTLAYDSVNMVYSIDTNTYHFVDTTITPHMEIGQWELINSEEDLQLRNDSSNAVEIYRILDLGAKNLDLRKGNEEFYLKK